MTRWLVCLACACALGACTADDDEAEMLGPGGGKADDAARRSFVQSELTDWNADLRESDRADKFGKMAAGPFPFYRGTNHLYWSDLGDDERLHDFGGEGKTRIWLQGDLHAHNYGAFHSDDGAVVFDLNDFDEVVIADYQLDVWRMATSLVLLAGENDLDDDIARAGIDTFAEAYLDALEDYRGNSDELDHVFTVDNTFGRLDDFLEDAEDDNSRGKMLDKWTTEIDDVRTLDTGNEKLEAVDRALAEAITDGLEGYGKTLSGKLEWDEDYFAVKSVARRLHAGIGSLGTPRFYVLIDGPSDDNDDDIILDVKRQSGPTGGLFIADAASFGERFPDHAERSAIGQKALATDVDDHLGWLMLSDGSYSVRERSPFKESFPTAELDSETRLVKLAEQWGTILATAHARADQDFDDTLVPSSFEKQVSERTDGHHSPFRELVWDVASGYAARVDQDFGFFLELLE